MPGIDQDNSQPKGCATEIREGKAGMKAPNKNACAMVDAIKAEWIAAAREERNPKTLNVLPIFRKSMKPRLNEKQIQELFEIVFECYLEVTGVRTEYSNN
jgi:hypothetical protein